MSGTPKCHRCSRCYVSCCGVSKLKRPTGSKDDCCVAPRECQQVSTGKNCPYFPACQVRVRFYQRCAASPSPFLFSSSSSSRNGHSRASSTNSRSQWAAPALNCKLPSPVGSLGPQPPEKMPEDMPDTMPEDMPHRIP